MLALITIVLLIIGYLAIVFRLFDLAYYLEDEEVFYIPSTIVISNLNTMIPAFLNYLLIFFINKFFGYWCHRYT